MAAGLPPIRTDIDDAKEDLRTFGMTRFLGAAATEEIDAARERLIDQAAEEDAAGVSYRENGPTFEAMPDGGSLRLELQFATRSQNVSLVVTDTGSGMLPAELDLVFKPYFTTKRNGLGLGMALVKRIMERFGGEITLHSRKGEGTLVNLIFKAV